jgi:hypothetical protein
VSLGVADDGYLAGVVEGLCIELGQITGFAYAERYADDYDGFAVTRSLLPEYPDCIASVLYFDEFPSTPGVDLTEHLFQVRTRATDYDDAITAQSRVLTRLDKRSGLQFPQVRVSLILGQPLAYLGLDPGGRHEFTRNYRVRGNGRVQPATV